MVDRTRGVTFRGSRTPDDAVVIVDVDGTASPLKHEVNHSPSGFDWGYGGSGPADLARSLCAYVLNVVPAPDIYQRVKCDLIATLDEDSWEMPASRVMDSIARAMEQRGARSDEG